MRFRRKLFWNLKREEIGEISWDQSRSVYFRKGQTAAPSQRSWRQVKACSRIEASEGMLKNIGLILIFLCVLAAKHHAAIPRRSISDEQVVARAERVASGARVEINQNEVVIEPTFLCGGAPLPCAPVLL
jgi:hypothetical protein